MSNNNQQNGSQPPLSQKKVPTTTALRPTNVTTSTEQQIIQCRDFVRGICTKGSQCKYRHELEIESMKGILKFCHDYQNRAGCTRPDCTYLHTSIEEENLFLTTGQIPRALAERYAGMSAAQTNSYMSEYMKVPPPVPPPQLPLGAAPPPPPLPAPLPLLLAPPPSLPPPPPVPPPTSSAPAPSLQPPPFNAPAMFPVAQTMPSLPPLFDASRPPPPFANQSGGIKRAAGAIEAGPSKASKAECSKVLDTLCESCVEQEHRLELKSQELQQLEHELNISNLVYEKTCKQYEDLRAILQASVSPEMSRKVIENMERVVTPQMSEKIRGLLSQFNAPWSNSMQRFITMVVLELLKKQMDAK